MNAVERVGRDTGPGANNAGLHDEGGHSENGRVVNWTPGANRTQGRASSIPPFNGVAQPQLGSLDIILAHSHE